MANRYWVGGAGTWSATNTTNWSTTSGGTGGASVPTAEDDVFLDANSGTAPFTVDAYDNGGWITSRMCRNLDCTGFTGTLLTDSKIEVYGSLTLNSTMGLSGYSGVYNFHFKSTTTGNTVQPGGNSAQGRLVFNGVGGEWSLQGAVSVGGSNGGIQVLAGTFITNGYSVYTGREGISSTGTAVRSLQLGASTITISGGNFNISGSNVTVTHTGTLTCGAFSGTTFAGGGGSYGNVTLQTQAFDENNFIYGTNTFQNLTIGGSPLNTIFYDNQTITGTFTCNGSGSGANSTTQWRLVKICSAISGDAAKDMNPDAPQRTISASTFSVNYATFQNIALTGTGAPISGIFGDAGNNSGIIFPAAKTVYARNTTSGNLYTTIRWSTTSGGTADVNTIPLAHDTIVLDANTGTGSLTMPGGSYGTGFDVGTINASNYSGTLPFPSDNNFYLRVHGSVTIGSTATVTGTLQFYGVNAVNFSSGSNIAACNIRKKNVVSVTLASNITSTATLTHISGTLKLNNYNYSTTIYSSNYSNARKLELDSGSVLVTGNNTTVLNIPTHTNFTWSGTGYVNLTYSGATGTRTISFGNTAFTAEAYTLPIKVSAGTDIVGITTSTCFFNFPDVTGFTGTLNGHLNVYGNCIIPSGPTAGTLTRLNMRGVGTSTYTLSAPSTITFQYLNIEAATTATIALGSTISVTKSTSASTGFYHISGIFDIGNYSLFIAAYNGSGTSTRAINFGPSGVIYCYSWSMADTTNFSVSDTSNVVINNPSTSTATVTSSHGSTAGTPSMASALNFSVDGGAYTLSFSSGTYLKTLDIKSGFTGTWNANSNIKFYRYITHYNGLSISSNTGSIMEYIGTENNGCYITLNGANNYPYYLRVNGTGTLRALSSGGTNKLDYLQIYSGTFDLDGQTVYMEWNTTITGGTLKFNGGTLNCTNNSTGPSGFNATGTGAATVDFTNGTYILGSGGGTLMNVSNPNLTILGQSTGVIRFIGTSTVNNYGITGGGLYYPKIEFTLANTTHTFNDSNTFHDINVTALPNTLKFASNTTTSFINFSMTLEGLAGGRLSLVPNTSTQNYNFYKESGDVVLYNTSIQRCNATGNANWHSYIYNNNVDAGNNNARWIFNPGKFFSVF